MIQRISQTSFLLGPAFRRFHSSCSSRADAQTSFTKTLKALIIGPPGGGKGTISQKIIRDFDCFHLSSGDLLRAQISSGSKIGLKAAKFVNAGDFVPDDIMLELVVNELEKRYHGKNWILDGFPRTFQQAKCFSRKFNIELVIHLDIPFETIVNRISNRLIHLPSGRIYNLEYKPPRLPGLDDITGEALTQRLDDSSDKVYDRLRKYEMATLPLIDFYRDQNVLVTFSGNQSDTIYASIKPYLENIQKAPIRKGV